MEYDLCRGEDNIREFLKSEFPGHAIHFGNGYWYVHVDPELDWNLHYEYHDKGVHLDIEGNNWKGPRNFFRTHLSKDHRFTAKKWWRQDCRWTFNRVLTSWEDVKEAFIDLHFILKPHILAWKKEMGEYKEKTEPMPDDKVSSKFITIGDMLRTNLHIPNYQRPYIWTKKNVEQLLCDINNARLNGKLRYLIGNIILHRHLDDTEGYDIVDGQQRLTTLCLILRVLGSDASSRLSLKFNHSDSFHHIKENYNFILQWFEHNLSRHVWDDYAKYLTDSCEVVEIIVSNLSEAFQLFETQNGRGKELEAYNLLKAYHLRSMAESTSDLKRICDIRWENAALFSDRNGIPFDLLRQIINENLYRIRIWTRGKDAIKFCKEEIDEFKGFTFGKTQPLNFVYQNQLLQQMIARSYFNNMPTGLFKVKDRFVHGDPDNMNPFVSINQMIINGEPFFEYVETYVEIYKRLFIEKNSSQLAEFKTFYQTNCKNYPGACRVGDRYVRQVYKSAIIMLFDRFGEIGVNGFYKDIYAVIYDTRLSKSQVKYSTMTKQANGGWLFALINEAKTLADLAQIKLEAAKIREKVKSVKLPFYVDSIADAIKSI